MRTITAGLLLTAMAGCRFSGPAHFTTDTPPKAIPALPSGVMKSPIPPMPAIPAVASIPLSAPVPSPSVPAPVATEPPPPPSTIYTPQGSTNLPGPGSGLPASPGVAVQDVMLIPRMVYVPYAPQTPTAPARLNSLMPPMSGTPTADAGNDRMTVALERATKVIDQMDSRIRTLEEQLRQAQNPPIFVPPQNMPIPAPQPVIQTPPPPVVPITPPPVLEPIVPKIAPPPPPAKGADSVPPPIPPMVSLPPMPHEEAMSITLPVADLRENTVVQISGSQPAMNPMTEIRIEMPPPEAPPAPSTNAESRLPKFPSHYLRPYYPWPLVK